MPSKISNIQCSSIRPLFQADASLSLADVKIIHILTCFGLHKTFQHIHLGIYIYIDV